MAACRNEAAQPLTLARRGVRSWAVYACTFWDLQAGITSLPNHSSCSTITFFGVSTLEPAAASPILMARGLLRLQCIDRSVQSWLGHTAHADTYSLRRRVFSAIALRRCCGVHAGGSLVRHPNRGHRVMRLLAKENAPLASRRERAHWRVNLPLCSVHGCVNDCNPEGERGLEGFLSRMCFAVDAAVFYFGPQ